MIAKDFPEANVKIAEHQPQYETLPAFINQEEGSATFCFELTPEELEQVGKTGCIWIKQFTFNGPMQPVGMSCIKEHLLPPKSTI